MRWKCKAFSGIAAPICCSSCACSSALSWPSPALQRDQYARQKLVVEARLKGAGMHWAPAHVNPLRALRGMACSDRWEEGWPQLVTQWRAQAQAQTRERRQRRQAARQAARDPADAPTIPPEAVAHSPTPGTTSARQAHVAPAVTPHSPSAPRHLGPARPRRPAADHCWRRPFLTHRSSPDPGK